MQNLIIRRSVQKFAQNAGSKSLNKRNCILLLCHKKCLLDLTKYTCIKFYLEPLDVFSIIVCTLKSIIEDHRKGVGASRARQFNNLSSRCAELAVNVSDYQ